MKPKEVLTWLNEPTAIAPLAGFRVLFGLAMFISTLRFILLGWVDDHYIQPLVHFTYYGFSWVKAGPAWFMYAVHGVLLLSAIGVMLGYRYRLSAVLLFLCFTYTELIDLSYYLNHYYYVSLVCLLLIFLPAHAAYSFDAKQGRQNAYTHIPRWMPLSLMGMMAIVYTCAGLAKINQDWLIHALPLKIWLPASYDLPVLGPLFAWKYSPWIFSWAGMLYDCSIAIFLFNRKTRPWAYLSVIIFHSLTGILFQIGVFPLVMMAGTLIFFSADWHTRWLSRIRPWSMVHGPWSNEAWSDLKSRYSLTARLFALFFAIQLIFPWRYLLYPGNLFWTEEGYRFSWRVMLVEKAGTAQFYVQEQGSDRKGQVVNSEFLNLHQEKQMSYQPDMLLQYARFLHEHYKNQGLKNPVVTAEVYVTMNGRPSHLYIDSTLDLAQVQDNWKPKTWIKPYPWNE
ncbi:MAG TPA: HTTM domain-containing protein [Bacteroidetes bacterium]|nr:HTTM domain-containing protein [Bacteroidota bacterium]